RKSARISRITFSSSTTRMRGVSVKTTYSTGSDDAGSSAGDGTDAMVAVAGAADAGAAGGAAAGWLGGSCGSGGGVGRGRGGVVRTDSQYLRSPRTWSPKTSPARER